MSWLSDLIRNEVIKAFADPVIQEQARQAIIRVLDDKEVRDRLYEIIDARIKVVLSSPDPLPPLQPTPVEPGPTGEPLIICDLETLPEQMRADGILFKDTACWYGVACAWAGHGWTINDETMPIYEARERIHGWFERLIQLNLAKLRGNPNLQATAIAGDGRDRCGFIIGPAIMERFKEFGSRVTLGHIVPESEY